MYLLGHWDPKFTMRVYQQVLNMGGGAQDQLESPLGCTCEGAFVVLTGRWFPARRPARGKGARGLPADRRRRVSPRHRARPYEPFRASKSPRPAALST
jgi:hypothetical protein